MAKFETVYSESIEEGALDVYCMFSVLSDGKMYKWEIDYSDQYGNVFFDETDDELYDSRAAAEAAGRLFMLMNEANI